MCCCDAGHLTPLLQHQTIPRRVPRALAGGFESSTGYFGNHKGAALAPSHPDRFFFGGCSLLRKEVAKALNLI